jgi:hypothetical protein
MPTLYDRSVAELMVDAAQSITFPATRSDVVGWFAERYPNVKSSTVRAHVVRLTVNDSSRHHYAWLARREPLFTRDAAGVLTRFESEADEDGAPDADEMAGASLEFALEAYLEEFPLTNWAGIDWGRPLDIWESEGGDVGHQFVTEVGRLDFLCRDRSTDALVVVELKRGRPTDRVVGQAARYMGWVRANIARSGQVVEGIIVAHEQDIQLSYAVSAVPGLIVLTYHIDFSRVPAL